MGGGGGVKGSRPPTHLPTPHPLTPLTPHPVTPRCEGRGPGGRLLSPHYAALPPPPAKGLSYRKNAVPAPPRLLRAASRLGPPPSSLTLPALFHRHTETDTFAAASATMFPIPFLCRSLPIPLYSALSSALSSAMLHTRLSGWQPDNGQIAAQITAAKRPDCSPTAADCSGPKTAG